MRAAALAVAPVLAAATPTAATAIAADHGPRLAPPVRGQVARAFDYAGDPFARGHHRGLDLAATPGARVRAACSGRVTFAGRAGASGGAVTIRCGAWSVTHLPLRELVTRAGDSVAAGAPIGAAAASRDHAGLHLGVRRAGDRLGYVDPEPLLRTPTGPLPPAPPRRPATRTHGRPPPVTRAPPTPPARPGSSPTAHPAGPALAPWPAWAGLVLLLCGAAGAGTARAARRRRAPLARAVAREVP